MSEDDSILVIADRTPEVGLTYFSAWLSRFGGGGSSMINMIELCRRLQWSTVLKGIN